MDRPNYGLREYTVKVSSGGIYVLVLNPEGIPAARIDIGEYASIDDAVAVAEERAQRLNRNLRGDY